MLWHLVLLNSDTAPFLFAVSQYEFDTAIQKEERFSRTSRPYLLYTIESVALDMSNGEYFYQEVTYPVKKDKTGFEEAGSYIYLGSVEA